MDLPHCENTSNDDSKVNCLPLSRGTKNIEENMCNLNRSSSENGIIHSTGHATKIDRVSLRPKKDHNHDSCFKFKFQADNTTHVTANCTLGYRSSFDRIGQSKPRCELRRDRRKRNITIRYLRVGFPNYKFG